jgi:hypothetical protein
MKEGKNVIRPVINSVLVVAAALLFIVGVGQGQSNDALASSRNSSIKQAASPSNVSRTSRPADTWVALGSGLDLDCNAIAVSGSDVYVGGAFTHAGGVVVNSVAKWNGSTWSALGSGMNNAVNALGLIGNDLYAGGPFTFAGGSPASRIARWDGSTWSPLSSGLNSTVFALATAGSDVYVGGQFTTAGGVPANYIAKWNGSTWSALGSGTNGFIYAIAVSGSDVYVGGQFTTAGGVPARNIAKWDGGSWSALGTGTGPDGPIESIAIGGSNVYITGSFPHVNGVLVNYVARWDGSAWYALGSGLGNAAYTLATNGPDVYVGGRFTSAGAVPARRVAGWNGSEWFDLAGGVSDPSNNELVYALATASNGLYVGGTFTLAGGAPAMRIALYQTTGLPRATPSPSRTLTNTPTNTETRAPTQAPSATRTVTFTPEPGDTPPTLTVPLNRPYRIGVEVGNYLALRFDAHDPDAGDIVSMSATNLPSGSNFPIPASGNPIYSTFTWRPTAPDIGTYYVTVTATDSHGARDVAVVQIDVVAGCVPYFSDVFTLDYFYPSVQYLFCHLVVSGYIEPDQTFTYRPYNNTTRGQFSKMIARAYSLPPYNPPTPDFTDVPPTDTFYSYIEAAYHAGIIAGYADHTFHPYASITRGQLSKLIVNAAGWQIDTTGGPHFNDTPADSPFYGFIETAFNHGVITGYADGSFRPGNSATRGQIAKILWQALGSPPSQ